MLFSVDSDGPLFNDAGTDAVGTLRLLGHTPPSQVPNIRNGLLAYPRAVLDCNAELSQNNIRRYIQPPEPLCIID